MKSQRQIFGNFILLSDLTTRYVELNEVVYVPSRDRETNIKVIKRICKDEFNVDISQKDLDELLKYNSEHLDSFINKFKSIIRK